VKAKRSLLHKIVGGLMVATFFFATTPHDFVHDELAAHRDTVDYFHKYTGVSKIHIHCDFLRVSLSPTLPGHQALFRFQAPVHYLFFVASLIAISHRYIHHHFLRGPPHIC